MRTKKQKAVVAVERVIAQSAFDARQSERKWWRQEIAKLINKHPLIEQNFISELLYISEKRGGEI